LKPLLPVGMMRAVEAEGSAGIPPRVFLSKSAEVIENKGQESQKERQER
jgi:hypothetical protein